MTSPLCIQCTAHHLAAPVDFSGLDSIIDTVVNDMDTVVQEEAFALLKPFLDDG